ncbi:acyl carrier protein [Enterococcus termitis]
MVTSDILEKILIKVCEKEIVITQLNETDNLFEYYEMDSLEIVNFLFEIETTFNIVLEDEDYNPEKVGTVTNLIKLIDERKK